MYENCYGPIQTSSLTAELVARRREKITIDALEDLVTYLRGAREERKAIITITDGWLLYGPSSRLGNIVAPPPQIGINPGTGKPQIVDRNTPNGIPTSDCNRT